MSDDEFWLRGYNSDLEEMPTVRLKASSNCTLEEHNDYLEADILRQSHASPNSPLPSQHLLPPQSPLSSPTLLPLPPSPPSPISSMCQSSPETKPVPPKMVKKALRKDTEIPVLKCQPKVMSENILPSKKDVLQHFWGVKHSLGDPTSAIYLEKYNGSFLSLAASITAKDLIKVYHRGKIPTQSVDNVRTRVLGLRNALLNIQKKTKKTEKNIQHKEKFLKDLNNLFDVSTKNYIDDIRSTRDKKTAETDIYWLKQVKSILI